MGREAIMAAHERERQVVQLFIRGLAWVEIGRQLGISDNGAKKAFDRAVKRIPPKDADLLRTLQSERFADYRRRLFTELAGREKPDPANPGQKVTVRPEVAEVGALVGRLAAIDRQEADLYGINAPSKSEVRAAVTGQAISDEELDIWIGRLTPQERETFMMLLAKAQGRWVEPPTIEGQGVSVETTAVTMLPNGAVK
jgi:hypothetical protein